MRTQTRAKVSQRRNDNHKRYSQICHGKAKEGAIIAMKSLGGFHLVVDANNENAVSQLRTRKRRDAKAFAIMVRDANHAARIACVSSQEKTSGKQ